MNVEQQYRDAKKQFPDILLLFVMGDFCEAFGEDADTVSKALGLTLTSRDNFPMCGFPTRYKEAYVRKLLQSGKRVAVCEPVLQVSRYDKDDLPPITPRSS